MLGVVDRLDEIINRDGEPSDEPGGGEDPEERVLPFGGRDDGRGNKDGCFGLGEFRVGDDEFFVERLCFFYGEGWDEWTGETRDGFWNGDR